MKYVDHFTMGVELCLNVKGGYIMVSCTRCSLRFKNVQHLHRRLVVRLHLCRDDLGVASIQRKRQPRSAVAYHEDHWYSFRGTVPENIQGNSEYIGFSLLFLRIINLISLTVA